MTIGTKSHKANGVERVLVSEATRQMAKPSEIKFVNYEQERQHYIHWRSQLEAELKKQKTQHLQDIDSISKRFGHGTERWHAEVASLKSHYRSLAAPIREQLSVAMGKLNELKAKVQNLRQRNDPFSIIRDDGEINNGAALYAILKRLESIEALLARVVGSAKQEASA